MTVAGFEIPAFAEKYLGECVNVAGAEVCTLSIPDFAPLPLAGMLAFGDEGNGDQRTLYWPEDAIIDDPIVVSTSHDVSGLIPEASSFEAMLRLWWASTKADPDPENDFDIEEFQRVKEMFPDLAEFEGEETLRTRHQIDPNSPFLLTAVADLDQQDNNLDAALTGYQKALQHFPAYTAARSGLVQVLERLGRHDEASQHSLEVIISPLQLDGRTFWSEFNLPITRVSTHQTTADKLKTLNAPANLPNHLKAVWDLREEYNFNSDPPNWRALTKLSDRLQVAGHLRQAVRVQQGLAPMMTYALDDFDEDRYYRKQLELYEELGDERRITYIREKLGL